MRPIFPVLTEFPFVGVSPSFDIYVISRFEPMPCLCFAVGRILKECIVSMHGYETRRALVIEFQTGSQKSFKSIKRLVLSTLITVLRKTEDCSAG